MIKPYYKLGTKVVITEVTQATSPYMDVGDEAMVTSQNGDYQTVEMLSGRNKGASYNVLLACISDRGMSSETTMQQLQERKELLEDDLTDINNRIEYCKGLEEGAVFDEMEYTVATALKTLSSKDNDKKKTKVVAGLIRRMKK